MYIVNLLYKNKGEIKTFADRQKLKEFITTRPALSEMLLVEKTLDIDLKP